MKWSWGEIPVDLKKNKLERDNDNITKVSPPLPPLPKF
jgi:hypothetical protein